MSCFMVNGTSHCKVELGHKTALVLPHGGTVAFPGVRIADKMRQFDGQVRHCDKCGRAFKLNVRAARENRALVKLTPVEG